MSSAGELPVVGAIRLDADANVTVGYPAERGPDGPLVLGTDARVRSGSVLYTSTSIGDRFTSGHNVVVREQCSIGDDVAIWSNTVVDYGCVVGDRVKIHANCYIAQFTRIDDGAFLAPGVSIANDLYPGDPESAERMRGPVIGAGAQIGVGSTLLPYVSIGAGALIGSGSVVTGDVRPGWVAMGNPARETGRVADLVPIAERLGGEGP